jgi:MFS superfamily sulfate permease-like transporter
MTWLGRIVPAAVVRGVQVTLGLMLAIEALKMIRAGWWLGLVAIVIVIALRRNRYAPAALVLMGLGLLIMLARGQMRSIPTPAWQLPVMTGFRLGELWPAMMLAGFAQIPLTATNAVISTASLIKKYWPERAVTERQLALNQGVMNLILPFFGGMPLCHGAGGLVGQYYFGARTGGTNILEGLIEITLGLVLANSIKGLFGFFPRPIIGAMMFLVGLELVKFSKDIFVLSGLGAIPPACSWRYIRQIGINRHLMAMALTILVSLTSNMAVGFTAGCLLYALLSFFFEAPATLSTWP